VIALGVTLVFVPIVTAQQKDVITVTAKYYSKEGKEAEIQALMLKMAEAVKKEEPDCLCYRPHRSEKSPTVFLWYEQYRSDAALEFHRKAPHLADYRKQLGPLLAKPTEVETYRSLAE
jgi:quinol monooxygenase YgiN